MTKLSIPEMSCGHCKATVEKTIKAIDPLASLTFDMTDRTVVVQTAAPLDAIQAALSTAGYETANIGPAAA